MSHVQRSNHPRPRAPASLPPFNSQPGGSRPYNEFPTRGPGTPGSTWLPASFFCRAPRGSRSKAPWPVSACSLPCHSCAPARPPAEAESDAGSWFPQPLCSWHPPRGRRRPGPRLWRILFRPRPSGPPALREQDRRSTARAHSWPRNPPPCGWGPRHGKPGSFQQTTSLITRVAHPADLGLTVPLA